MMAAHLAPTTRTVSVASRRPADGLRGVPSAGRQVGTDGWHHAEWWRAPRRSRPSRSDPICSVARHWPWMA